MILAVDVGNSITTISLFDRAGAAVFFSELETDKNKSRDQFALYLLGVFQLYGADIRGVQGAILSCVVPPLSASVVRAVERLIGKSPLVIGPGIRTGLNIRSDLHNQLGGDIVASSVAALARYPSPVIVIDMSTATTFSLLRNGIYEGCAICPGVRLGLEALSERAAELPHISVECPPTPLGRNTIDAMRSGVLYGNAGMVDSMIARFEEAGRSPAGAVVATGGNAPLILPYCRRSITYDPNLLMDGLYLLYQKNADRRKDIKSGR